VVELVVVQPIYPARPLARGIEGFADVQYTVTPAGGTADFQIVSADPPRIFDKAAMQAASRMEYRPKLLNATAVAVSGVVKRFRFEIED